MLTSKVKLLLFVALILAWLTSLASVGYWQYDAGINAQKATDQIAFDKINDDITKQKTAANALLRDLQDKNLALLLERDKFKTELEKTRAKDRQNTANLRQHFANASLRFASSENTGYWNGSNSAERATANTAGNARTAFVELPRALTNNLRQLTFEADELANDYRACYTFIHGIK